MKVSKHDSLRERRRETVSFWMYEWSRRVAFHAVTGRTQHPVLEHYNKIQKVAMTPCIVLWNGGFDTLSSPPLADNDVDVAETDLKEGEWQNISWLPFHLNTSIKARGGWVSGVASAPDTDSPAFMQQKKLNVYCFGDLLDPRPDGSRLKILHVRYITLQQLISTANSRRHSFHPAYRNNGFRTPKASGKIKGERQSSIPLQCVPSDSTSTTVWA